MESNKSKMMVDFIETNRKPIRNGSPHSKAATALTIQHFFKTQRTIELDDADRQSALSGPQKHKHLVLSVNLNA